MSVDHIISVCWLFALSLLSEHFGTGALLRVRTCGCADVCMRAKVWLWVCRCMYACKSVTACAHVWVCRCVYAWKSVGICLRARKMTVFIMDKTFQNLQSILPFVLRLHEGDKLSFDAFFYLLLLLSFMFTSSSKNTFLCRFWRRKHF